ncbi:flagellar biosynthesis anti-sigma factor FlgM [Paenibacillus lactis]|uniref:Negative regulator of flagellin synthesis n=2 Tax=Paenibacillus lactis TaxID=228574 RepID=G4HMD8_9BACL|nr:flagellar biosynthesis anti-sigma factor FlgM [Paenibacillus lactis]EHB54690.1 Anti-sigma-28 factor FlgM family protein [Paenibacillus lactis 154]MBP1891026.1 negative regulator of flagellin synthesis FlgM [Paenibacillus lactis]HAF99067.1 flagellar biosynthesis anti-sigma factor FlgM [Paenibacillus lactis]
MKINESGRVNGVNSYQRNIESRELQHIDKKKRKKDEVSISPEAMELSAQSKVQDPERAKKIQRLKEAVSNGTYEVPADRLVDKLLPYFQTYNKSGESK